MINGRTIYQNVRKILRPESVTNRKFASLEVIIQYAWNKMDITSQYCVKTL